MGKNTYEDHCDNKWKTCKIDDFFTLPRAYPGIGSECGRSAQKSKEEIHTLARKKI